MSPFTARLPHLFASLALLAPAAGAWDLFLSVSQGYTHYRAADLNEVLVLLEKTTQQQGFNNYQVNQFDGHPQKAAVVGWRRGPWRLGLEAEFWVEEFAQSEVPFDLENAARTDRITCDQLRDPAQPTDRLYGCVDAKEIFNFVPLTLQASYGLDLGRSFRLEAGYGIGVMAGSATIELATEYFGEGAVEDDRIRFDVWPGLNPVQKVFADAEYLPLPWLGLNLRGGWRFSQLAGFELRDQKGRSLIFEKVFPGAGEGARLYVEESLEPGVSPELFLGTEAQAEAVARDGRSRFDLVQGDFTGWFASLKLNFYWRDI